MEFVHERRAGDLTKDIKAGWHPFRIDYRAEAWSEMVVSYEATCGGLSRQVVPSSSLATLADPEDTEPPQMDFSCNNISGWSNGTGYQTTATTLSVYLRTNEPTTASLFYANTADWNVLSVGGSTTASSHAITARGLAPNSSYYFWVETTDISGNVNGAGWCWVSFV